MLARYAKAFFNRLFTPVARGLLRAGISPDVITVIGTIGVVTGSLAFYPRGELFVGTVVIAVFVFSDTLDGTMARLAGRASRWGAFLDSTLDRIGDGAVFGGLVLWFAGDGDEPLLAWLALAGLVFGFVVSYARARAEGLGLRGDVGIFERSERLVTVLVATGLSGLGVPYILEIALWAVALLSVVTMVQRMVYVRRQIDFSAREDPAA
ncbi:MAG: phosphatidylinositol phosphate synthase [Candidatus Nanopelagicales bacterium]